MPTAFRDRIRKRGALPSRSGGARNGAGSGVSLLLLEMTALLIAVVILLAAILITLLTAWKVVGIVLGGIVSLVAAIYVLDELFGTAGVEIGFALVAVAIFGLMF